MKPKKSILDENLSRNDPRVKQILVKMKKENYRPDALIEILHTAQNSFGLSSDECAGFYYQGIKSPAQPGLFNGNVLSFFLFKIQR